LELLRTAGAAAASRIRVGVAEMMGRRLRMEDSVHVIRGFRDRPDEAFFGLYDAHSGSDVCEQAAATYAAELARELGDAELGDSDTVQLAMEATFLRLNSEVLRPIGAIGGAVAVAILLKLDRPGGGTLYCANVGDARAVLCRNAKGVRISRDFKPFDDDEYNRIFAAGGWVSLRDGGRVCDDLALTRALGDLHLSKFLQPVPHFYSDVLDFTESPFIIIGCDGVWDVLSDQGAADAVSAHAPDYLRGASALRDLAFAHGSTDNISAMVIDCTLLRSP